MKADEPYNKVFRPLLSFMSLSGEESSKETILSFPLILIVLSLILSNYALEC